VAGQGDGRRRQLPRGQIRRVNHDEEEEEEEINSRVVALRCVALRYVTLRYVTLRYVTLRYVTLRYVTLRYVTLRYVTLRKICPPPLDISSSCTIDPHPRSFSTSLSNTVQQRTQKKKKIKPTGKQCLLSLVSTIFVQTLGSRYKTGDFVTAVQVTLYV
jgi:hypothetical protein